MIKTTKTNQIISFDYNYIDFFHNITFRWKVTSDSSLEPELRSRGGFIATITKIKVETSNN